MNIKENIIETLQADDRLWNKDKTELNQTLLLDLVEKIDEKIIGLLLQVDELREKFFVKIKDVFVFKTNDFRFFMEENKIDNSYTAYKNRIGLTDGKRFLKDTNDVVLNWPYKDCVLEGGQSTEEGKDTYFEYDEKTEQYLEKQGKRKEIFFNSVLAHDEIDRLFDPKALTNWKRFTKDGEIPLFEGWTAKQDGVDDSPEWQKKSLFPFWTLPKNKKLNERAKELRKQGILSEVLFWKAFKDKEKTKGYDVDRQVIIGNFIIDFFIAELGLVIEIDGSSHDDKQEYDSERQAFLEGLNLQVIRYADSELKKNIDGIHKDFLRKIEIREEELRRNSSVSPDELPPLKRVASTPSNASHLPPLKRGIDGTIKENLIIKGNNLLALHSLKKQFAGKVKLIYIDPPYNTGNDGFKYNDNFNHSTWLTFMKNRLEVARELLRDDGVIFVQCDDNEQAYLKVLMDEVFGRENFVNNIVREGKVGGGHDSQFLAVEFDYIILYTKNINSLKLNKQKIDTSKDPKYKLSDSYIEKRGKYYLRDLDYKGNYSKSLDYPITLSNGKKIFPGGKLGSPNTWRWSKDKFEWGIKNDFIVIDEEKEKIYIKQYEFVDNNDELRERYVPYRALVKFLNTQGTQQISKISNDYFSFPKSEELLQYIIEISTQPNDIVLDYHLGSGTTVAVAHKMGRQYIGIEQMDYIETIAVERLKKVIDGEQGGISKSVNWQGGGDFIYFELAKWNETAKEKILECESFDELIKFFDEMYERYFLNYNLKIKEFREKVIFEDEFKKLNLEEQKKMFIAMLDNNQMYVNKTEMEDEKFGISKEDRELTRLFYNGEK